MKKALLIPALIFSCSLVALADDDGTLENSAIAWQWQLVSNQLTATLRDKASDASFKTRSECFQLILGDGKVIKASGCQLVGAPRTGTLVADAASPTVARNFPGQQLTLEFADTNDHLTASWQVDLREGSTYLQQRLTLRANGGDVLIKEITLFDQTVPGAKTVGVVDGAPVVAGNFFCGYEHPMAQNLVTANDEVQCRLTRNAVLKDGESLEQSFVLGVTPAGQLRRGFLAYIERERTHPYRPFLHYNSWFDIAWDRQKFDEAQSLDAIDQFGHQLMQQRGVQLDSYLFDDGWDDNKTLWQFHSGFPHGFIPLRAAAARYGAGIGVWVSPFGGYDVAKVQRLKYGSQFGYETNASGFSLAGSKYYQRFHDLCLEMIRKYGVNQFKFDGLAAGAKANENGMMRDGDAMLRLVKELRAAKPDIYINLTTGTWPSPFWLLDVDSTWRGGDDHNFQGQGTKCQQWMTYRDAQTYHNVVQRAPLYPLNSLMLHGIIYATNASFMTSMSDADFADQAREFFGNGTQLQEMYITPKLLDKQNWDDLAETAKWSRRNADVLVDTHWIGGDPGKGQVYGWASWSSHKAILVLRNPTGQPATFAADVATLFELPAGAREKYVMHSPWEKDRDQPDVTLSGGEPHTFALPPFAVLVLEETNAK